MKFPFEFKIFFWASEFSSVMTSQEDYAFLMLFNSEGVVREILFGDEPRHSLREKKEVLIQSNPNWLFYDPYDAPESGFIAWRNIDRTTMERLIKNKFDDSDFVSDLDNERLEFPRTWRAIY